MTLAHQEANLGRCAADAWLLRLVPPGIQQLPGAERRASPPLSSQAESAAREQPGACGRHLLRVPAQLRAGFTGGRWTRLPGAQLKYCLAQPGNAT